MSKIPQFIFGNTPPSNQWEQETEKALSTYLKIIADGINKLNNLTVYANNAAALAAGLSVGDFYRDSADPSRVCVVY